jgi:DNA-binding response OmpR family regulator
VRDIPGTILIADDGEAVRLLIAARLRDDGFACDCAEDGRQALEMLSRKHYDVLIAEVRMEGNMDLALVRAAGQIAPGMPVILITGYPSLATAMLSIELSVMAYLQKPLDFAVLRQFIERAMEHSTIRRGINEVGKRLAAAAAEFAAVPVRLSSATEPVELIPMAIVHDVAAALAKILHLRAALGCRDDQQLICQLVDCEFHRTYLEAIAETIETLRRTKNSFKSRELGNLRLRLESILEKPHALPQMHGPHAKVSVKVSQDEAKRS